MSPPLRHLVIIPAWNESQSIRHVVQSLRQLHPQIDIVVIDDGSTDNTARSVPPQAKVISLPFNLGIGGAMQTGYRYALMHGYDIAVQVDADGQHPPQELGKLLPPLLEGRCDMVVGSRFLQKGLYEQSPSRMVGIRLLNHLIRLLTGQTITDCTSGFRAVNRRVIAAFAYWYPDDYPEPEVVLLLRRAGFSIAEVPVRMDQRHAGRSSISFLRGLFYLVKVSVALILDTVRNPWPKERILP